MLIHDSQKNQKIQKIKNGKSENPFFCRNYAMIIARNDSSQKFNIKDDVFGSPPPILANIFPIFHFFPNKWGFQKLATPGPQNQWIWFNLYSKNKRIEILFLEIYFFCRNYAMIIARYDSLRKFNIKDDVFGSPPPILANIFPIFDFSLTSGAFKTWQPLVLKINIAKNKYSKDERLEICFILQELRYDYCTIRFFAKIQYQRWRFRVASSDPRENFPGFRFFP